MKIFSSTRIPAFLIAGAIAAVPSVAFGAPVEIGERNPSGGAEASKETEIIAQTGKGSYGTRQSNKGGGGGAIYGCRSALTANVFDPDQSTPCLRVNNLSGGKAFDFVFDSGPIGGIIQSGNSLLTPRPQAAPFITNATAVAVGLNADRVDGKHLTEIVELASANAKKLGGFTAEQIVAAGQQGGTACPDGTVVIGDACIETAPRQAANWDDASAACASVKRHLPTASELTAARTLDEVDLGAGEMSSDISAEQLLGLPVPFLTTSVYATVAEDGAIASRALTAAANYRCIVG